MLPLTLLGYDVELGRVELGIVDEGFRGITGGALDDGTIGVEGPGIAEELFKDGAVFIAIMDMSYRWISD